MRFAYKYRLYPNQAQVRFLENQLLYNAALQERRDAWKVCRKSIHYYDQAKQLKPIREEGLLGPANFSCCQDVLRRLDSLSRGMLSKAVHDASWASFIAKLAYKAEEAGRQLVKVDPRGTSQRCPCGARVPKKLSDREHVCTACGLIGKRDHVSAMEILRLGLSLQDVTK